MKTTVTPHPNRPHWREVGGQRHYFRSLAESRFACFLQFQKDHELIRDWSFECKTFWFEPIQRGTVSYLPDFEVTHLDGEVTYIEVKGFMDPKSRTKLKRMSRFFPDVKVRVIDANWFRSEGKKLSGLVPGWNADPAKTQTL